MELISRGAVLPSPVTAVTMMAYFLMLMKARFYGKSQGIKTR
jgi:hypothetical protein